MAPPPLTDRNPNANMAQKRKRVEVDLTGDSDQEEGNASSQKARRDLSWASAQTAPRNFSSSGAPSSSQTGPRFSSSIPFGGYRSVYGGSSTHPEAERSDWLAEDADDFDEIVGSTQEGAEGSAELILYGELASKIVGVQYYRGVANAGEHM